MLKGQIYVGSSIRERNPDMNEVFMSCMACYAQNPAFTHFWVKLEGKSIGIKLNVRIRGIDHESGKVGMLLLEGFLEKPIDGHTVFSAFYDAQARVGNITLK